jgi:hypothetical protein
LTDEWLEVARQLADQDSPVAIRRAVSTAYYAVFHALARCATDVIRPAGERDRIYGAIYRTWNHTQLRESAMKQGMSANVREIGALFSMLQKAREQADYDPGPVDLGPGEVNELVQNADDAIRKISEMTEDERTALVAQLLSRRRA